jgi:predicted RNA-binding protein YlxR (DUF448 family)
VPTTRTCIACRRKASPEELVRLVSGPDGVAAPDPSGRAAGRGAWVHPAVDCLKRLHRRPNTISRALRRPARLEDLEERIERACEQSMLRALPRALASGCVVSGRERVLAQLARGEIRGLLVASDISPRTLQTLLEASEGLPFHRLELDRRSLGERVGKGPRSALAVRAGTPAEPLLVELRRCTYLGYPPPRNRSGDRPEATRPAGTTKSRGRGLGTPSSPASTPRKRGQPPGVSPREGSECPRKRS